MPSFSTFTTATELSQAIIDALGFTGRPIAKLVLVIESGRLPFVEVTEYLDNRHLSTEKLNLALKQTELEPADVKSIHQIQP